MYFLVASGLSLIYGLMGVLNFAHGALITVGAYCACGTRSQARRDPGRAPVHPRVDHRDGGGDALRRLRRAGDDPPALRPPHRAGARHGRARALRHRARDRDLGATTRSSSRCRRGRSETTTVLGAHIPNDRWIEILVALAVLFGLDRVPAPHALRADRARGRREPLDGHRARDRRAQGLHARVRDRRARRRAGRRARRDVLRHGRPAARHEPADLRLHRGRDRRARVDLGDGDRRRPRGAGAAVRELLRLRGRRRPLRRAAARGRAA